MDDKRFFFLRDMAGRRVACVASVKADGVVKYAVSTHNPKDTFDREMAKKVAFGRLHTAKVLPSVPLDGNVKQSILTAIKTSNLYPQRTREAAAQYPEVAALRKAKAEAKAMRKGVKQPF